MRNGTLTVGPDHSCNGGGLVPANGGIDGSGSRLRAADADGSIFPDEAGRVEAAAQQVVDIAAFRHHHHPSGALVQPVHRVEHEVRATLPGQGPRHGGGIRQEVGGVGRHPGRLVHHQ